MIFKSKAGGNNYELNYLLSETERILEQIQHGNLKVRVDYGNFSSDIKKVIENINGMLDSQQSSVDYMVQRFQLVNKLINASLWDMEVIAQDPVNADNKIIWTDEFRHMLGYSNEQDFPNILSSWSHKLHPDDYDNTLKAFVTHLKDYSARAPYNVQCRLKLKSGEYHWFCILGDTMRRSNGEPVHTVGLLYDIHDSKLKEEQNEFILTRFELVNKASQIGLWDMEVIAGDPVNPDNKFTWTDEFRHMLGYSNEQDFPNILSSWSDKLHPNDHDKALKAFVDHLNDYSSKTPYSIDYRLKLKNETYRWFHAEGGTIRNKEGIPLRVAGSIRNITDEKVKEKLNIKLSKKIEDFYHSMKEMVGSIESITTTAQELANFQQETMKIAQEIKTSTKETEEVIEFIKNLSNETNLLGLNASIEAARSGSEGRGFQVVASEIRKLSVSSSNAVEKIGSGLKDMNLSIEKVVDNIGDITNITHSQAAAIEEVSACVEQINILTQDLLNLVRKIWKKA
ncbi:PAS domain-containing protein [Clostridium kluyveri]|uniref:methyl-accepting chemotaxis protein n=2 Tax=Clostridium kluyveri TaxID=1534 RepID=UPI0022483610|nr:PAS domain-containing protein [Clostridium kluyveri]UZQ51378.1 PAS domain-containing protein [Clostridium kluyveri]